MAAAAEVMTPEQIDAEARLLREAGPLPRFFTWETLPECFKEVWRMRVEMLGERADLG